MSVSTNIEKETVFSPIVISVYDRLAHLSRCVESLARCSYADKSDLHIISDAPAKNEHAGKIEEVRAYIKQIDGFKKVVPHYRATNMGAHKSISFGIEEVFRSSDSLIFLEDDIIVSPHFLRYMNDGLRRYEDDSKILGICAYRLPFKMPWSYHQDVFLGRRYSPWGVGLWKKKWEEIDFSERDRYQELLNDSKLWAMSRAVGQDYINLVRADSNSEIEAMDVRICHHQIIHSQYCLFPKISLSTNIGFDGSGIHCSKTDRFSAILDTRSEYSICLPESIVESKVIASRFRQFQDEYPGIFKYQWRRVHNLFGRVKSVMASKKKSIDLRSRRGV